jgi:hypothetical protein
MNTLPSQVVTQGREILSRATRQTIQSLIPTLLVVAGGSLAGIDLKGVATLAGMTALVSLLSSATGLRTGLNAPLWVQLAERSGKAAAGTALGLVTVGGFIPATVVNWETVLTASFGAALMSLAMFYTNPPVVAAPDVDGQAPDTGAPIVTGSTFHDGDPFPNPRDGR